MVVEGDGHGPVVVLMCGIAGSGKTTFARRLERDGFERLSIDEELWLRHGRYGLDYPATDYEKLSAEVEVGLQKRLVNLITQGQKVVIDFSFWQKSSRDYYKQLIERNGGTWRLIYLRVRDAELRRRLEERGHRFDANAAFPITPDRFALYLNAFEEPNGEGEEVVS